MRRSSPHNDFFHWIAPYYDTLVHLLTFGGYEKFLRKAVKILAPQKGEKILDLCSGTGKAVSWMAEAVGEKGEVVGVDITQSMINVAKEHYGALANVIFLKKDVTQPWNTGTISMESSPHFLFMNSRRNTGQGFSSDAIRH